MKNKKYYVYIIYEIGTCPLLGYVGETNNIDRRWREHKKEIVSGEHPNYNLRKFKKCIDRLIFKIISVESSKKDALNKEYAMRPVKGLGMNIATGGSDFEGMCGKNNPMYGKTLTNEHKSKISVGNRGKKVDNEGRKNISKAKLGNKNPMYGIVGKDHPKSVRVYCIDLHKEFDSALEAAIFVEGQNYNIIACCRGKRKSHKGHKWKYV